MARVRMVTRTVEQTTVTALCMTISTQAVSTETYIMGQFNNDDDLYKAVKKAHETADFKVVAITDKKVDEVLYGMEESEFIKLAKVLPPRSKTE